MYEAFYGLREKPFNLTPDPKFLYLSDKHKEAFAHLLYGIKNHSGFVMLTGEIGTGKTTICRNLLNQLDPDTELAFVFNPALSAVELLKKINDEFGINSRPDTALELVEALNRYLLEAAARTKNCVLVIDEAQNLTPAVLEQIRLLSNLETEKDKLLQIILIGQPELAEVLALKELRQLNQRITARYHLKPLTENETLQYIAYRLHVAGGRRKVQFDRKAVRQIYRFSGGVPRVINAVCDRALLMGYTKELRTITAPIVAKAAKEIRGERIGRRGTWLTRGLRKLVPSPALMVTALVLALIFYLIFYAFTRPLERMLDQMTMQNARPAPAAPPPTRPGVLETVDASATPEPAPETESAKAAALRSDFITTLLELDPATARAAAGDAILGAWKADTNAAPPAGDDTPSITTFALANDLAYETLTPALDQLLALNLPAFVKLRLGTKDLWLALAGTENDALRVTTRSGETALIPREEFLAYYAKEAVIPWRDPAPGAKPLWPNTSGEQVARLKEALRRLRRLPEANTSDEYDPETAAAVSRLQSETGLLVDGLAGKQVRMVLTSWLPETATPALKPLDIPIPAPNTDVAAAAQRTEAPLTTSAPPEPSQDDVPAEEPAAAEVPAPPPPDEEPETTPAVPVPETETPPASTPATDAAGNFTPETAAVARPPEETAPPPVTEPAPPISEIPETPPPLVPTDSGQQ